MRRCRRGTRACCLAGEREKSLLIVQPFPNSNPAKFHLNPATLLLSSDLTAVKQKIKHNSEPGHSCRTNTVDKLANAQENLDLARQIELSIQNVMETMADPALMPDNPDFSTEVIDPSIDNEGLGGGEMKEEMKKKKRNRKPVTCANCRKR